MIRKGIVQHLILLFAHGMKLYFELMSRNLCLKYNDKIGCMSSLDLQLSVIGKMQNCGLTFFQNSNISENIEDMNMRFYRVITHLMRIIKRQKKYFRKFGLTAFCHCTARVPTKIPNFYQVTAYRHRINV